MEFRLHENVLQCGQFSIFCLKEVRASIVQNIEWVQFVLQNCGKQNSVQCLYDNEKRFVELFTPDVMYNCIEGCFTRHRQVKFCISKLVEREKIGPIFFFWLPF